MTVAPRTAIEKIVAQHAEGWAEDRSPRAGDFVTLRPRHVMTHDNTSAVIPKFRAMAGHDVQVSDRSQPVFAMDHDIQNHTPENLAKYASIRAFAAQQGVRYEAPGRGIAHQVMIEEGFVSPGSFVVGSDSHSNMYGAFSALGTPVVRTDAAAIWATGKMWWVVPPQVRVTLLGRLQPGVVGKDVILALCARFSRGEVLNAAVEFHGDGVAGLTIDDRMTIANMTTEWGAIAGWFPFDEALEARLGGLPPLHTPALRVEPDEDAVYARAIEIDLSTVVPHVTGPNSVSITKPATEIERDNIRVDKAYLMSCVNGRLSDVEAAAEVFGDDRRVADGVEFFLAAASSEVERAARASGAWGRLLRAGATPLPAGCGACIGLGQGTLEPGEVGISATNRNYEGRMGSREARCYLASPAVVAESAIQGRIAAPLLRSMGGKVLRAACRERAVPVPAPGSMNILAGFPVEITGRGLLLPVDDINTDGIYGKDVTYRDDITTADQGRYAMRNYDPRFREFVRPGDILVVGHRFGIGSSREQAVTALRACGVAAVLAASVSQTYRRNAFNNGFIVLETPELALRLFQRYANTSERTVPGPILTIDMQNALVTCDGEAFSFHPLSETAQRLIVAGGLEAVVAEERRGLTEEGTP